MSENSVKSNHEFPTAIIELPSAGKCYPQSNPLSSGTIEIKYMTAREEDILSSQNYIKRGVVLDKLFESVVVQEGVNPDDIIIGDKNAILLATRILGYGADYEVTVKDPFSDEDQDVLIDLSKVQTKDVDYSKLNPNNEYEYILPRSGAKLKFKFLTHKDEVDISKELNAIKRTMKNNNVIDSEFTTRLRYMILSVNDNTDIGFINKWIKNEFLAIDTRKFREHIKSITPDVELKFNFVSDITGDEEVLDIPIGIGFFYPTT